MGLVYLDWAQAMFTLSHLGDLIHSQPGGGGGGAESATLRNFVFPDPIKPNLVW